MLQVEVSQRSVDSKGKLNSVTPVMASGKGDYFYALMLGKSHFDKVES